MQYPRLRFSLFTLLALPAMFAFGWCTRDRNYNRDVYAAADVIVSDAGRGVLLGDGIILSSDRKFSDRYHTLSPDDHEELERRLQYFDKELKSGFDPPRPNLSDSIRDVVAGDHAGTTAEEERAKRVQENAENEAKRKAFFEKIQVNGRTGGDRGRSQTRGTRTLPPGQVTTNDAGGTEVMALVEKLTTDDQGRMTAIDLSEQDTVTDEIVKRYSDCRHLIHFHAIYTNIKGPGLEILSKSHDLETLDLYGSPVGDEGLALLKELKNLRHVNLIGSKITDDSVPILLTWTKLEYLGIADTPISREGAERLKARLPGCEIDY